MYFRQLSGQNEINNSERAVANMSESTSPTDLLSLEELLGLESLSNQSQVNDELVIKLDPKTLRPMPTGGKFTPCLIQLSGEGVADHLDH